MNPIMKKPVRGRVAHLLASFALISFMGCQAIACLFPSSMEMREDRDAAHCPTEATPEVRACGQVLVAEHPPSANTIVKIAMQTTADTGVHPWHEQAVLNPLSSPVANDRMSPPTRYLLARSLRI